MTSPLVVALLLAAAPDLVKYGYQADAVKETALSGVTSGGLPSFAATPAVKALPVAARAAAVQALAGFVKAWVMSPEFKAAYAKQLKDLRGPPPAPKRSAAEIAKERRAEMEKNIKEMMDAAASAPKDAKDAVKLTATEMRKSTEAMLKNTALLESAENDRFAEESAAWEKAKKDLPDDVTAAVKQKLELFLEETKDIDYQAALKSSGGRKVFAKEDYEAKGSSWKMGFRAGKEATEAARAFVSAWLKELR